MQVSQQHIDTQNGHRTSYNIIYHWLFRLLVNLIQRDFCIMQSDYIPLLLYELVLP